MINGFLVSNGTLIINGEQVPYEANSLTYSPGFAERKPIVESVGSGNSNVQFAEDRTTAFSTIKFKVLNRDQMISKLDIWYDNGSLNSISIRDNDVKLTFTKATLVTNPDMALSNAGGAEITFNSNPVT